jgi:hypothetical protein
VWELKVTQETNVPEISKCTTHTHSQNGNPKSTLGVGVFKAEKTVPGKQRWGRQLFGTLAGLAGKRKSAPKQGRLWQETCALGIFCHHRMEFKQELAKSAAIKH